MTDEVSAIVRRELGSTPEHVERVEEGLLHETYEIRCEGGRYILQFGSEVDDDKQDSLRRGLGCYTALQNTDIPVPEVVTDRVRTLDGREYSLVEKLPGTTGERDISPARTRNAGRLLARIHRYRRFDRAGWIQFENGEMAVEPFEDGSLKRRLLRKVERCSDLLCEGGLDGAGGELERLFDRRGDDLPEQFQPVLCHDDFSPDNVLFAGSEITGIVDFDRARASHAQRDLVHAANAFWMHDPCVDWGVRTTFYEGYRDVRDPRDSFEGIEPLYRVETLARTVAGMVALDECSDYERDFYDERIREAIERLDR
jgi:Ser/Thr protein kinase RdoA (MazF antagonist)